MIAHHSFPSILDKVKVFEFDTRFESFGKDFQFYDYNKALEENYLAEYEKAFNLIIVDPPFLSEECLEKTSVIVKRIMTEDCKVVLNTGSVQRELAAKFLGLKESNYKPQHKNNLGNEFSSFANFDLDNCL
jgi:EEF1A lysine methyltransferase 1